MPRNNTIEEIRLNTYSPEEAETFLGLGNNATTEQPRRSGTVGNSREGNKDKGCCQCESEEEENRKVGCVILTVSLAACLVSIYCLCLANPVPAYCAEGTCLHKAGGVSIALGSLSAVGATAHMLCNGDCRPVGKYVDESLKNAGYPMETRER